MGERTDEQADTMDGLAHELAGKGGRGGARGNVARGRGHGRGRGCGLEGASERLST